MQACGGSALSRTGTLRHLSLCLALNLQPPYSALSHVLCPTGTSSIATRLHITDRGDLYTPRRQLHGSAAGSGDDPGLWYAYGNPPATPDFVALPAFTVKYGPRRRVSRQPRVTSLCERGNTSNRSYTSRRNSSNRRRNDRTASDASCSVSRTPRSKQPFCASRCRGVESVDGRHPGADQPRQTRCRNRHCRTFNRFATKSIRRVPRCCTAPTVKPNSTNT